MFWTSGHFDVSFSDYRLALMQNNNPSQHLSLRKASRLVWGLGFQLLCFCTEQKKKKKEKVLLFQSVDVSETLNLKL